MDIRVTEIFSSLQGEGFYAGAPHLFVRLAGCDLGCRWCDTASPLQRVMTAHDLVDEIQARYRSGDTVSFTGGEPLEQAEGLAEVFPHLVRAGIPIYLETNGTIVEGLRKVIVWVTTVAMDIKLPSSAGVPPLWERHEAFLRAAVGTEVFVKIVVTPETDADEFRRAVEIIRSVSPEIPLCVQPETGRLREGALRRALECMDMAREGLRRVRVLPQVHRLIEIP